LGFGLYGPVRMSIMLCMGEILTRTSVFSTFLDMLLTVPLPREVEQARRARNSDFSAYFEKLFREWPRKVLISKATFEILVKTDYPPDKHAFFPTPIALNWIRSETVPPFFSRM
jgi:hypothetical protein